MIVDKLADNIAVVVETLQAGKLVVLRTDTLYGVIATARNAAAVENLRLVRQREPGKAFITLIATAGDAFGADGEKVAAVYQQFPPTRPTSVVVEQSDAPNHLLNSDASLAYRIPLASPLGDLLSITGPLVAPSANPAGLVPARSAIEARNYFADQIALYVDDGETPADQLPSNVIKVDAAGAIIKIR